MEQFSILEQDIEKFISDRMISGASIAIFKDGKFALKKCFGLANIEKNYPITFKTRFRLASMTKPVTAVAAIIAQELGLLSIDDKICKYIPSLTKFRIKNKDGNFVGDETYEVTIRQLLMHTAGLGTHKNEERDFQTLVPVSDRDSLEKVINHVKDYSLSSIPGTKWFYSALTGFDVVARIIEVVSRMNYFNFLKKYIFDPLGMNSTVYNYDDCSDADKAISYKSEDGKLVYVDDKGRGFDDFLPNYNGGSACLISTIEDYSTFAIMLLNKGVYNNKRIFSEKSYEELITYSPTPNLLSGGIETFGLSFYVRTADWQPLPYGCFGWSGAYGPHFWVDPKNNMAVVYMHNSNSYGGAGSITGNIIEADIVKIYGLKQE